MWFAIACERKVGNKRRNPKVENVLVETSCFAAGDRVRSSRWAGRGQRVAIIAREAQRAIRGDLRSDFSFPLYLVGRRRWSAALDTRLSRFRVPPPHSVIYAVVLEYCRRAFFRGDNPRRNRFAVSFCSVSERSVPPRIRFSVHSFAAIKVAGGHCLGGLSGDLRRNRVSRLHAASDRAASRSADRNSCFVTVLHVAASKQNLGNARDGSRCLLRRACCSGFWHGHPARLFRA